MTIDSHAQLSHQDRIVRSEIVHGDISPHILKQARAEENFHSNAIVDMLPEAAANAGPVRSTVDVYA